MCIRDRNSGHGVDTHARVKGLGAALGVVGLGVGGRLVVVIAAGGGSGDGIGLFRFDRYVIDDHTLDTLIDCNGHALFNACLLYTSRCV